MKKLVILIALILIIPFNTSALSKDYTDKTADVLGVETDQNKVNLYLFHGAECPHCEAERKWLKKIKKKYKDNLNVYYYEVWHDKENASLMKNVKKEYKIKENGVPLTIIGDDYYVGYSDSISSEIENKIEKYIGISKKSKKTKIPVLGKVDAKKVSIPLVAVILGFIDGFNPCAMWILLFLINMLFGIKDKEKAWILGITFLFISGFVYFLSMLGMNFFVGLIAVKWLKIAIALFILGAGFYNFKKYLDTRNEEVGCKVVDDKKRRKIITRIKNIINSNSFTFSLIGITVLAVSVNLIELACSLGFPLVFTEILALNNIDGFLKMIYLLLYIVFYMLDDIVVFSVSMITLEALGVSNKYSKLVTLISAIIMIMMGILLIVKPEWLMLNF